MGVFNKEANDATIQPPPAVGGTSQVADSSNLTGPSNKRGHVCCGFCCDVRRAVIILDAIAIVLAIINLIVYLAAAGIYSHRNDKVHDDDFYQQSDRRNRNGVDNMYDNSPLNDAGIGWFIVYTILSIIFYALGVVGAIRFHSGMVLAASIFYAVSIIWQIISFNVIGIIVVILFLYPHIVLFMELRRGIMTPVSYKNREEHSLCCV